MIEACLKVIANCNSVGIDEWNMKQFDKNYKKYFYGIWNQISSGSYMPPAIKLVEIPNKGEGVGLLVIPTITYRIAKTVVKDLLE